MVSTLDFESNNPSSILGMSFFINKDAIKSDLIIKTIFGVNHKLEHAQGN